MKLNRGRMLTAMPGPSVIPDRVLGAMHTAMPNIYEGALIDTSVSIFDELPGIAKTSGKAFMAISNGHGAWEMALTNTLSRGDQILVLESGRFAIGWGDQAKVLGAHRSKFSTHRPRSPIDTAGGRGTAARRHRTQDKGGSWPCRSIRPPASGTTLPKSAACRFAPPGIRRCSWSIASHPSAAWSTGWMTGAST